MDKKNIILSFPRDAQEKKLITSNSIREVEKFRSKLETLKNLLKFGTDEYILCSELDEDFYDLLTELKEEFFSFGEIAKELEEN